MNPYQPLDPYALEGFEAPELEWIIEGIVPAGSLSLLTGREKSGKGLLGIDACASVAVGETFVDRETTVCPAMYAFGEENIREVRSRVLTRLGPLRDVPLFVLPLNGQTEDRFSLELPETFELLQGAIVRHGIRFLVLDTMREFHNRAEDSSDEMAPLIKPLRQMAHDLNIAVLLNHHQNKGNTPRGSTAILAATDQSISFVRSDTPAPDSAPESGAMPRGLLAVDGRFGPRLLINIELQENLHWKPQTAPTFSMDAPLRDRIIAHLNAVSTWQTAEQIAPAVGTVKKSVQNHLAMMVREQPPPIVMKGTGRKNDPRQFSTLNPVLPDGDWFPDSGNHGNHLGTFFDIEPANDSRNGSRNGSREGVEGVGNHFGGSQASNGVVSGNHFEPVGVRS